MDSLQAQVMALSIKIDALQQAVEEMGSRLAELTPARAAVSATKPAPASNAHQAHDVTGMQHKHVLADDTLKTSCHHLAPELQVQRLTAQLTAAYGRIAELEEQLLAQRIH